MIWSRDGRQLLLTNTFLPLDGVDTSEIARRAQTPMIVLYDLHTQSATEVAAIKNFKDDERGTGGIRVAFAGVSWNETIAEVVVRCVLLDTAGGAHEQAPSEIYRLGRDGWAFAGTRGEKDSSSSWIKVAANESLKLSVQQDINTPPVLCALSDAGEPRPIWDPNPQLRRLALGDAALYHWTDQQGQQLEGILVKPAGYISDRRYPLVIQAHVYGQQVEHKKFMSTGVFGTAWAGRALAARGFLVLQMPGVFPTLDSQDAPRNVSIYQAVIKQLADEGMVDPSRVGVVGFSHNGYYALYALAKHPGLFAAATVADGSAYDLMQYLLLVDAGNPPVYFNQFPLVLGGQPFGNGLKHWAETSPFFDFDQVISPLRIELHSPQSLLLGWAQYAALRLLNKPVDLILLPDASHDVVKPLERLASEEGDVDWFDFWLNGHEEPDPAKAEQYARWRELRKLEEVILTQQSR